MLCLTATLEDAAEKKTLLQLGMSGQVERIRMSPISSRVSFQNSPGSLNVDYLIEMVVKLKHECPRVLIFEETLVACGAQYLKFEDVRTFKT